MSRKLRAALAALLCAALAAAVVAPTAVATSGNETFKGLIVASGKSGTRTVVSSVVIAKGAFSGVGRIVEVENLPTDPDNVSRDDFVFAGGSIHIVSVTLDTSFFVNPRSCIFRVTLQQTGSAVGGMGRFAAATGSSTATVTARGLLRRAADGSCSLDQAPLIELDTISSSGTLSF